MSKIKGYNILIVDDEIEYQKVVSMILGNAGYNTWTCSNGQEALRIINEEEIHLVITDLKMPIMDGEELIKIIVKKAIDMDIMVMTAYGSIESAVDSIKFGAKDYFVKSSDLEELMLKVDRLAKLKRLERKSSILIQNQNDNDVFMETKNQECAEILEMCERAASSGINILLLGESGVGKEVFANYIHMKSDRNQEPIVPVNCQAFPEGVIESELFGHEKGSFTGASTRRIGRFEEANYGTIFLDEICDLPINVQGKLLRALETRKIERVGGNGRIDLDVRFISATNKSPEQEIMEGRFREDLLYRINTLTITIPPLRQRREDIPNLIRFFIDKIERDQKKRIKEMDDQVISVLRGYDYPGNVRELKNMIERMVALSKDGVITMNEMVMPNKGNASKNIKLNTFGTLKDARTNFEKKYIEQILETTNGNVSKCAEELGITARQLWNKISDYNIERNVKEKS
ncbi:MAG: sigma-54 dependent transcriptional regulator [Anaerovoracaceae bacterium]